MEPKSRLEGDVDTRTKRVRQVVMDCLHRRNQGDVVSDESLIREHADLMPELGEDLRLLRLFQSYRSDSDGNTEHRLSPDDASSLAASPGLHVRCPYCHRPVDVSTENTFTEITCSECGSQFSLVDDHSTEHNTKPIQRLGHFELEERLGVGGFGTVWKARDTQLDRTVAVKIPRGSQLETQQSEQFLREARATAQLRHPHIVSVHEIGRHHGELYIVSDYVEGITLADWFRQQPVTQREAAELCATLADAMHHAHQAGVIHRDLKPSNIMLDAEGEPHVMDFGLAKRNAGEITMTVEGKLLGTPAYMSPEQAQGEAHQADHRTDIYSLGAILFELLTGELPFRGNTRTLIHQVVHDEPPSPRKLNSRIPRDLETICLKCLEKDPSRRYSSARVLSEELRRFLSGEPILARPITVPVRAWRWCWRNPLAAAVVGLLLFLAVAGPIIALNLALLATRETKARIESHRLLYASDSKLAQQAWEAGNIELFERLVNRHGDPDPGQQDLRGFEWYYHWQRLQDVRARPMLRHSDVVSAVAFAPPESNTLAVANGNEIWLWDMRSRTVRDVLEGHEQQQVTSLAYSPDGGLLASAGRDKIVLWAVSTSRPQMTLDAHADGVTCLAFSPDGKTLASGGDGREVRLWNIDTGQQQTSLKLEERRAESVWSVAFSPDGSTLATANYGVTITLFDVASRRKLHTLTAATGHPKAAVFSPDGATLVSAGSDALIRFWDLASRQLTVTFPGHAAPILSAAFSPDGKTLSTSSLDGTIKLWDVDKKLLRATLRGHRSQVMSVVFSGSGHWLASGSSDGTAMLWDLSSETAADTLFGHDGLAFVVDISHDGKRLVASGPQGALTMWDVESRRELRQHKFETSLWCVTFAPDGKTLALGTADGVKLWDVHSWQEVDTFPEPREVICVRFSPDGKVLAAGNRPDNTGVGSVFVWELATRQPLDTIEGFRSWYTGLSFSPLGDTLAIPRSDNSVLLWDVSGRRRPTILAGHRYMVRSVAFSSDGQTLASASKDSVRLWDRATGVERDRLEVNQSTLECVAFCPNRRTLATSGRDGTIKLWNLALMQEVAVLRGHTGPVSGIVFSRDGRLLASGGFDTKVQLWSAATDAEVRSTRR